jgi:hypothetical protein
MLDLLNLEQIPVCVRSRCAKRVKFSGNAAPSLFFHGHDRSRRAPDHVQPTIYVYSWIIGVRRGVCPTAMTQQLDCYPTLRIVSSVDRRHNALLCRPLSDVLLANGGRFLEAIGQITGEPVADHLE